MQIAKEITSISNRKGLWELDSKLHISEKDKR